MTPENCKELMALPDVDGFLVGKHSYAKEGIGSDYGEFFDIAAQCIRHCLAYVHHEDELNKKSQNLMLTDRRSARLAREAAEKEKAAAQVVA